VGRRIAGRRGGPPANTEGWTATFLTALAEGAYVRLAAATAEVHFTLPYKRRRTDAAFRAAWEDALELGTAALEDEAVRRAYHGVEEPVFYQGVQCGSVTKYSDRLLIFLLKARNPKLYGGSKVIVTAAVHTAVFDDVTRLVASLEAQEVPPSEPPRQVEAEIITPTPPTSDPLADIRSMLQGDSDNGNAPGKHRRQPVRATP
jgi:hypothetical protein